MDPDSVDNVFYHKNGMIINRPAACGAVSGPDVLFCLPGRITVVDPVPGQLFFLRQFLDIGDLVYEAMLNQENAEPKTVDDVLEADRTARELVAERAERL